MSSDVAKTKGIQFEHVRAFVLDRFGAPGWDAVMAALSRVDQLDIASVVTEGWYSLALYARFINAVDVVHGCGDYALVVQLGRFEAERDLPAIQRFFMRFVSPAFAVEKVGEYWSRFHDTGSWKITQSGETVSGVLEGWGTRDPAMCRELVGYIGRLLELVGARNVLMQHPKCRSRGDAHCYFEARWGSRRALVGVPSTSPEAKPPPVPTPRDRSGSFEVGAPPSQEPGSKRVDRKP